MLFSRDKIEKSISSHSFGLYIDALKLIQTASSFNIQSSFYAANSLFYEFAQYDKPFENETQFIEAFELHDELYEIAAAENPGDFDMDLIPEA